MRRDKLHLWLMMLLLIFGVAAREAPEILSLADDWSNDGTAVSVRDPLPKLIQRRIFPQERIQAPAVAWSGSATLKMHGSLSSISVSAKKTGKILRHFLSIQRV
ncbi:MAG: hypothetical protein ABSB82_25095 [Terriglobia bacterium]